MGQIDPASPESGFVGFRVEVKDQMNDYRATAIYERGMNAGGNADDPDGYYRKEWKSVQIWKKS